MRSASTASRADASPAGISAPTHRANSPASVTSTATPAAAIAPSGPYTEIPVFVKSFPDLYEQTYRTLSYCDCMNLAPMIKCRTVVSNCLWDDICPPSTIYGVYNHLICEKQIEVYPFHKHEV